MKAKSERRRPFIGDQIEECRDASGLFYILCFQRGYLVNWDVQVSFCFVSVSIRISSPTNFCNFNYRKPFGITHSVRTVQLLIFPSRQLLRSRSLISHRFKRQ